MIRTCLLLSITILLINCSQNQKREKLSPKLVIPVGHIQEIRDVSFSPDNSLAATASRDATVKIWDVKSGRLIHDLANKNQQLYFKVQFSPSGNTIASFGSDRSEIWSVAEGKMLFEFVHKGKHSGSFSKDGKFLMTFTDSLMNVWDVSDGRKIFDYKSKEGIVEANYTSIDESIIAIFNDGSIATFPINNPSQKYLMKLPPGSSGTLSSDGNKIIASLPNDSSLIFDSSSGKLLTKLAGRLADYSIDGSRYYTTNVDRKNPIITKYDEEYSDTTYSESISVWETKTNSLVVKASLT